MFGHFWVQYTIRNNFWNLKFVLQVHLTLVKTSKNFENFSPPKVEKFHVKMVKNWNFSDSCIFQLLKFLFYTAFPQIKISNGVGHFCECSHCSVGALRGCIWKRYSRDSFFCQKLLFWPKKKTYCSWSLWSPMLIKSFRMVFFSSIIHPKF